MMSQVITKVTSHAVRRCFCGLEEQQNMFLTDLLIMKGSFASSNDIMFSLVSGRYMQVINLPMQETVTDHQD